MFTKVVYLAPVDSHKSFYGKARVELFDNGAMILWSYSTPVAAFYNGTFTRLWSGWSATTQRHVNAFICYTGADVQQGKAAWLNLPVFSLNEFTRSFGRCVLYA